MPALYSHTTRTTGTILTSTIYNSDHQNHIDNGIPAQLDDYSATLGQMQTNTDPGEVGTESLATNLAGEIERLRFAIKEIKDRINGASVAQWYVSATGDLAVADGGTGASTAVAARTNLGLGTVAIENYTSGSWTPILTGGTSAPTGIVYNDQVGKYTQIGNKVFVEFYISGTITGAGAGGVKITGLPYTSVSPSGLPSSKGALGYLPNEAYGYVPAGTTFILIGKTTAGSNLTEVAWGDANVSSAAFQMHLALAYTI